MNLLRLLFFMKESEGGLPALDAWLARCYPRDVPMPVVDKRPLFPFANGAWTRALWRKYRLEKLESVALSFRMGDPIAHHDVAIMLCDLCVLDVDSAEVAAALEAQWPVLLTVPREKTARGMHYFFVRSALCDSGGFFDSRAPVLPMVDFKTRHATGTPGVIVVAPSRDKKWILPPWKKAPAAIPADLLHAVAAPRSLRGLDDDSGGGMEMDVRGEVNLVFEKEAAADAPCCSCLFDRRSLCLAFGTLRMLLADFGGADELPIGRGDAASVSALLFLSRHGELPRDWWLPAPRDEAAFRDLTDLADFLGCNRRVMHYLRVGARYRRVLAGAHPGMLEAAVVEAADPEGAAVRWPFDAKHHLHMRHALGRWSPEHTVMDGKSLVVRTRLVRPFGYVRQIDRSRLSLPGTYDLPTDVFEALTLGAGRLMLAGGGALFHVLGGDGVKSPMDYDLFVYGEKSVDAANELVDRILAALQLRSVTVTNNTVTLVTRAGVVIQIVLRLYSTPVHVLRTFDVQACKVAILLLHDQPQQQQSDRLEVLVLPSWCASVSHSRTVWVDPMCTSPSYPFRLVKYWWKGFSLELLCEVKDRPADTGAGILAVLEDRVVAEPPADYTLRHLYELLDPAGSMLPRSDYEEVAKMKGVEWAIRGVVGALRLIWRGGPVLGGRSKGTAASYRNRWIRMDPESLRRSFHPSRFDWDA
jgi:Bifunctional DNA primase/polymerase, N-terminal